LLALGAGVGNDARHQFPAKSLTAPVFAHIKALHLGGAAVFQGAHGDDSGDFFAVLGEQDLTLWLCIFSRQTCQLFIEVLESQIHVQPVLIFGEHIAGNTHVIGQMGGADI
jgi:hypothetical protein